MPQIRLRSATVFSLLVLAGLGGCVTRVNPQPSAAIVEMRAQAASARTAKPVAQGCPAADAPVTDKVLIVFPFLEPTPDNATKSQLADLAILLHCPGSHIALTGEADNHGTAAAQKALIAGRVAAVRDVLSAAGVTGAQYVSTPGAAGTLTVLARGRDW